MELAPDGLNGARLVWSLQLRGPWESGKPGSSMQVYRSDGTFAFSLTPSGPVFGRGESVVHVGRRYRHTVLKYPKTF